MELQRVTWHAGWNTRERRHVLVRVIAKSADCWHVDGRGLEKNRAGRKREFEAGIDSPPTSHRRAKAWRDDSLVVGGRCRLLKHGAIFVLDGNILEA